MTQIKRHPLYHSADKLKRAFVLNGFHMLDDEESPELLTAEAASVPVFAMPKELAFEKNFLEDGSYALRSELLGSRLSTLRNTLPLSVISCGRVYEKNDADYPSHLFLEGIYANPEKTFKDYGNTWEHIVEEAYGLEVVTKLEKINKDTYKIILSFTDNAEDDFVLGYTGKAGWTASALLGTDNSNVDTWIFVIDIDSVAIHDFKLTNRAELYSPLISFLEQFNSSEPAFDTTFSNKISNILRKHGYLEYSGMKLYEENAYHKMNMIQESWDSNNKGVTLCEPLGNKHGLPTVLTPSLEEALSQNYKAGMETVKIFEFGHIFLPGKNGAAPKESTAVSIGMYGPEIDKNTFKKEVDTLLTEFGIKNHFFIPTNMAIAYNTSECWLVLDENPAYLGGNFGGVSPIAEQNHGIGTHAFMANLEIKPLRDKASEEYAFIPNELK